MVEDVDFYMTFLRQSIKAWSEIPREGQQAIETYALRGLIDTGDHRSMIFNLGAQTLHALSHRQITISKLTRDEVKEPDVV